MSTATETTSNVQNEKLEQTMMEKIFSDLESGKSYLTQPKYHLLFYNYQHFFL